MDTFIRPTLAVGLFAPLELTSAAVCLELLYFYALAHQDSFDVRWIARRSIAETLVAPLASRLATDHGLAVVSSARVERIDLDPLRPDFRPASIRYTTSSNGEASSIDDADALVLAVGAKGLRAILSGSPALASASPALSAASSLPSIDCVSVRLWLDRRVAIPRPANVLSRLPGLRGAGGTFFSLDGLQARRSLYLYCKFRRFLTLDSGGWRGGRARHAPFVGPRPRRCLN